MTIQSAIVTRPIIFSAPMVRAILAGRKTQTRRAVKPQPPNHAIEVFDWRRPDIAESVKANEGCYYNDMDGLHFHCKCPYGTVGERLWVRETFCRSRNNTFYRCDRSNSKFKPNELSEEWDWDRGCGEKWTPSIHMNRHFSRITLEITKVRVERLNDITGDDARAEGCPDEYKQGAEKASMDFMSAGWFSQLWESINGEGSWKQNPWVWVVEFKVV